MPQHTLPPIRSATVSAALHGQRLDTAVSLFLPDAGTRERRRLFDTHTVLVNGRPRAKGHTVLEGDTLLLVPHTEPESGHVPGTPSCSDDAAFAELAAKVRIIQKTPSYAAVFKPGGMHSASIAGNPHPALESLLPVLFPTTSPAAMPQLMNRLDCMTSGMVLVAFGEDNAARFREYEDAGAVEKLYLAAVEGIPGAPMCLKQSLDTAKRKSTKVLETETEDTLRHTTVLPLGAVSVSGATTTETTPEEDGTYSLVLASIHKGARHQIRAHLAYAGHPIAGDPLYGNAMQDGTLYLHHYHVEFDSFSATCPPPDTWRDWKTWEQQGLVLPVG